ncbi:hypothetical protein G3A43_43165 [Paraburkholderia aspalathi]|uniref:hypothetical protein n=1 Tax=Paraburkholderia nemoris TaxID=2793076 RepID=UPI00190BB16A|nr:MULTISPECIES: hypothetical protein [Paraburkholderia]MBK3786975.1 hypothetical protein [Paraburkholderia aspalathi]
MKPGCDLNAFREEEAGFVAADTTTECRWVASFAQLAMQDSPSGHRIRGLVIP